MMVSSCRMSVLRMELRDSLSDFASVHGAADDIAVRVKESGQRRARAQ